jgi:hypothetical protein
MNQIILEHNASNEPIERYVLDKITVKECDLQSELEILLYREVLTLKNQKESMFKAIGKLENEIDLIRKELQISQKKKREESIREKGITINEKEEHPQHGYNTDEEQLEMDIEWCTQATRDNKKRKASSSPKYDDELQLQSNIEEHLQYEYNTDEEQLERDIGWCTQTTRKKKKKEI